ncbi:MAG: B12-binding domain-containing radical SAM protein, partial [Candidatus Sumerlaeota bacterium]
TMEPDAGELLHQGVDLSGRDVVMGLSSKVSDIEIEIFQDLMEEIQPDLVGFSLRSITMSAAARLTDALRQRTNAPVVWGGIGPTLEPHRALKSADLACRGEGEGAIVDLAGAVDEGKNDFSGIHNLWGRDTEGNVAFENPPRKLITNLDSLPFADMSSENKYTIDDDMLVREETAISNFDFLYEIASSRGCPFACTYCCNETLHRLYQGQPRVRRRSPEHVVEELKRAGREHRIERVNFQDDVFSLRPSWLEDFSQLYPQSIQAPFWCYIHPSGLKEGTLKQLREGGLKWATLGIQSGSPRILEDIYGRKSQRDAILETARELRRLGVDVNVDIITNNPLETLDDCRETLRVLVDLPKGVRLNAGLSKLTVFPNTRIAEIMENTPRPSRPLQPNHEAFNILYLAARQSFVPGEALMAISRNSSLMTHPGLLRPLLWPARVRRSLVSAVRGAPRVIKKMTPDPLWEALRQVLRRS